MLDVYNYQGIAYIFTKGLDRIELMEEVEPGPIPWLENIRGKEYYEYNLNR